MTPPRLLRLAFAVAAAAWLSVPTRAQEREPAPGDAPAFLDRLEATWQTRNLEAWLALREFAADDERRIEVDTLRSWFASDEVVLTLLRRPSPRPGDTRFTVDAQIFVAKEPGARVVFWSMLVERRGAEWKITSRQEGGAMDGLVHLSLGPSAFRARGVSLRQKDFELFLEDGTLFSSPEDVGRTLLVFVGRARVRFKPAPVAEREQLRQFSGELAIEREVDWAFVRMHPFEFERALGTQSLEPEPDPGKRRELAQRIFKERSERSFIVDAPLPRSPWWLMPAIADAVVDFPWGRKHVLTYALTSGDVEDVNLFDRDRRLQICSYASAGVAAYNEDDGRSLEVLEHDITARLEPDSYELAATHRMWVRLLNPVTSVRLRLDDDFRVSSVQSGDGGNLLFFRVRDQGTLVVSLGPLSTRTEPFTLVTRYAGRHNPAPVESELLQVQRTPGVESSDVSVFVDRPPIVYANRTAWYPHPPNEDYATAHVVLDTPEGWLGVTGGEQVSVRSQAGRTRAEFRLAQPGKYLTAIVGRLSDFGLRQEGEQAVRGYGTARTRRETLESMQDVERMMAFYAEKFGPSPYPMLGLVVSEAETPGGHSPPGLLYLQQRPPILRSRQLEDDPSNFSDLPGYFLAHETAHQWWGEGTAPANYRERWLSEAWAQYSAALWLRERQGERAFLSMLDRMSSWAMRHDAMGPIHLGQRLGHLKQEPRYFRSVVYDKGAWVLHMLRNLVGDEAFFKGARAFLAGHRYEKANTEDLRASLEAASGQDLKPYFDRWVYETGLPAVSWSSSTATAAGGYRTTVEVRPRNFPGPLPLLISVTTGAGTESRRVKLPPEGGTFTLDTRETPRRVELNEDRGLLALMERTAGPPQR